MDTEQKIETGSLVNQTSITTPAQLRGVIEQLLAPTREQSQINWLEAVTALVAQNRPDLINQVEEYLHTSRGEPNILNGLTIGELSVVYEALLGLTNPQTRKQQGQFFTPDDVAQYLSSQYALFPRNKIWLDPCCGVGNLSWHLVSLTENPDFFITNQLVLMDLDEVALKTAVVLLVCSFANINNLTALPFLAARSYRGDFLNPTVNPEHDYVIANPPYASALPREDYTTGKTKETFAYFFEKIAKTSEGYILITPASYLSGQKYAGLRELVENSGGGKILVFDNVPDTCFRGFKYGSRNTSTTNFVRAAITVNIPGETEWKITPILRWKTVSREKMWLNAENFLSVLRKTETQEWVKLMPGTEKTWDYVNQTNNPRLGDLVSRKPSSLKLTVASTPRYYITAVKGTLTRGSKHVLYFENVENWNIAYLLLNSSLPYWWWRSLDGGITLPLTVLLSLPVLTGSGASDSLVRDLEVSEQTNRVFKKNAGKVNENVHHPQQLVDRVNEYFLGNIEYDFTQVYVSDMFASDIPDLLEKTRQ